jgi:hypothetical protein
MGLVDKTFFVHGISIHETIHAVGYFLRLVFNNKRTATIGNPAELVDYVKGHLFHLFVSTHIIHYLINGIRQLCCFPFQIISTEK